ncbi:large ribosomal subunit protein uL11-like [Myotis yumanensis]|uniref:large ribosomal subunit protein uL11-like n=1 Tax=Myotis yumanensis TaxID=159337 RepID=UPI0038D22D6B
MLPNFNPNKIEVRYLSSRGKSMLCLCWPPRLTSKPFSKKGGDDITKATNDGKDLKVIVKLTVQDRQAQIEAVPSASALIINAFKEPQRDRKKQENMKRSGNATFDEIVSPTMQHRSLARELSGTIKGILGTAQSVGCNVDAVTLMAS